VRLTAENTAVVLDSTADLPGARERHGNWRMVPLYVRFGDEVFRDYLELGSADFYARLREASEPPRTSQPTPADFAAAFEELEGYSRILCVLIPGRLSGTAESARLAAESLERDRVTVIDSGTASVGIVLLADAIQRRLERGTDLAEIERLVERFHREGRLLFTVDTLDFLVRGGRVGKAAGLAGQLLSVKPILTIEDSEVVPLRRVRGRAKALAELLTIFEERTAVGPGLHVGLAHADAPVDMGGLADEVRRVRPEAAIDFVTTLGPVVGTHAGPGALGLFWFTDDL
jgi:fatty acid kinase fatty acid binding subunit